jgi:hypothetical protein
MAKKQKDAVSSAKKELARQKKVLEKSQKRHDKAVARTTAA